jgi:hypothetical protein
MGILLQIWTSVGVLRHHHEEVVTVARRAASHVQLTESSKLKRVKKESGL